jgi:hypothetical protein
MSFHPHTLPALSSLIVIQREFQTPGGAMVQSGKPLANRPLRRGGVRAAAILAIALATSGPLWAADPVFSPKATENCAAAAAAASPALSDHAVLDCVGRAAQACMMTPGGDTTYAGPAEQAQGVDMSGTIPS